TFTAAPHRMMFFAGAVQLLLPVLFWSIELIGRYTDLWTPLEIAIPSTWAHGFIMLYGVFIFFIFGFLFTVYPRWMNGPLVPRDSYISTFIWLTSGILLFQIGLFFSALLATIGLSLFLFGWAYGQYALFKVYRAAPARNKVYETVLNVALTGGWLGALSFLAWMLTDDWFYQLFSLKAGIWLFMLPVLFTVSHRMMPFFSSSMISNYTIVQPRWSLLGLVVASIGHLLLELAQLPQWLFLVDIPMAAIAIFHTVKWQFISSFVDRLLAVLHMAFLWLGIGMTLYSIQSLYLLITGELILARGPLHAITIGYFSSLLVAMASRVSYGHSGRMLILDTITWALFLGIQLAAILRVLSDTSSFSQIFGLNLNIIAVLLWLLCMASWVVRFGPIYLTQRVDGKPG
ncbi:MAG: NnrS family protein, partial [Gammaproteobacteria bacterium]|nr:NnrS family protein [Gammaproteobacteria bacterium]